MRNRAYIKHQILIFNETELPLKIPENLWSYKTFKKNEVWRILGRVLTKNLCAQKISDSILLLPKFNLWKRDWALGFLFTRIGEVSDISWFPKILGLKVVQQLERGIYISIDFYFVCDESHLYFNVEKF